MTVLVVMLLGTVANSAAVAVIGWHFRHRRLWELDLRPLSEETRRRFPADRNRQAGGDVALRAEADTTEALRLACVHYRALLADLLGEPAAAASKPAGPAQ
jgi:hypothetical protein